MACKGRPLPRDSDFTVLMWDRPLIFNLRCRFSECVVEVENHFGSQIMVLGPAASAFLGDLLEMQIFGLYSRPTELETLVGYRERAMVF